MERTNRPGKTVWECAADDVDRAETRLLDAMATGDDAEVAEAADHLASVQRRSGPSASGRTRSGSGLVDAQGWFIAGRARPALQARHPRSTPYQVRFPM